MRVLVTGAAGFLGSHLVDRLVADEHEVTGIDDLSAGTLANLAGARRSKRFGFHRFDVCSGDLPELVMRAKPDVALHLAVTAGVVEGAQVNVVGTVNLLHACVRAGVPRLVHASTGAAYGVPSNLPVTERAALHPVTPAGASAAAAEAYVSAFHGRLATCSLRIAEAYGSRSSTGPVAAMLTDLLAGRTATIEGDKRQTFDLVHVDDIVDGFVRALGGKADGRRLNLGTGTATAPRALHTVAATLAGRPDAPAFGPARHDPPSPPLDPGQARRALGWEPVVGLAEGMARTIDRLRGLL